MARQLRGRALPVALSVSAVPLAVWSARFTRLRSSLTRNAAYWAQPRGDAGGLLYVALGDSVAQGIGASSPDNGYVGLIAQRLRDRSGQSVQVINLSTSGGRIADVLESQLPQLANLGRIPDVLTVAIGGNDIRAYDRATFAGEVDRLTAALPTGTYLADAPYFMHGRWERDSHQAAEVLTRSALSRGLLPVALHEHLHAQGPQAMLTQFAADLFHPNDRGHRVWADAFWTVIESHDGARTT